MKSKSILVTLIFTCALLTGCCTTCSSGCGGCKLSYWSSNCDIPNSGGASDAAFTDIGNVCNAGDCNCHGCNVNHYAPCSGCGTYYSPSPNW